MSVLGIYQVYLVYFRHMILCRFQMARATDWPAGSGPVWLGPGQAARRGAGIPGPGLALAAATLDMRRRRLRGRSSTNRRRSLERDMGRTSSDAGPRLSVSRLTRRRRRRPLHKSFYRHPPRIIGVWPLNATKSESFWNANKKAPVEKPKNSNRSHEPLKIRSSE